MANGSRWNCTEYREKIMLNKWSILKDGGVKWVPGTTCLQGDYTASSYFLHNK